MNIIPVFVRKKIAHRPNLLKIADNIGWLFFDKILRMTVGLLLGIWLARYLGPEQFGLLNFALAFSGVFGAISTLGLQGIVVRDIVRDPASARVTLGTAAILRLISGIVSFLLLLAAIFYIRPNDLQARTIVAILGSMVLFKVSEIAIYWFESQVQSKYIVWVQNSVFILFAIVKFGLIYIDAPLSSFVWAILIESVIASLLITIALNFTNNRLSELRVSMARTKTLLKASWPLGLSSIAVMIYMKIDQIMLGQMIGDQAVGIYSVAVRISEVWYFIPAAIATSFFPALLEAKKNCDFRYQMRLQRLYDLMVMISVLVAIPMTFLSTILVKLLFGESYTEAGIVLAIHIWAAVFVFLGVASNSWFLAENMQYKALERTICGALANVTLNLFLIPKFGIIGSAVSLVVSQAISCWLLDVFQKSTRQMFMMKTKSMNPKQWIKLLSIREI